MALDNNMRMEKPGDLLQEYQSGEQVLSEDEKPKVGKGGTAQPQNRSYRDILRSESLSNTRMRDYTEEAKEAGFGLSRYDTDFYPEMDLEESRAIEQSGFAKIGTGLMKGGVTAATTAVNTTVGTVFGLGAALYELAADANGNGRSFMDTMDAGVNNWLSNQLVKIQNWAETAMPNYRTAEERSERYQREWWKHMGTANFIGDSILKNFGFTVGAMVGGMAWSKLIGAGLSKQLANNIMKGAVAAAEGDTEAAALLKSAADAVRAGTATEAQTALARAGEAIARSTAVGIDADKIVANIGRAAKAINKYGSKLQLYGAAVGAMGEGTVEGIMAKNEFLEEYNRNWEQQYAQEYNNIQNDVLNSGNRDWVQTVVYETPEGLQKARTLTDEGRNEIYKRQQKVTADYQAAKDYAEEQGNRLSSTTFLLNLPILTASNAIQFGRMLSGGWKTSRSAANSIKGSLRQLADGMIQGDYRAVGTVAGKTVLGSLKVAGSESFEEMAQGTVSSGAKAVANKNLATFTNDGFDEKATNSVRDWFSGMYAGGKEYLADPKNWQEGAIGALTGLFGIPGRQWSGGVVGAYSDAKNSVETDRATAAALNERVNSPEFQKQWRGYIRHLKYDDGMNQAVKRDDPYAWHTEDDKQLINDVMMFADAGKLDDLESVVSYYGGMSTEEAQSIKEAVENGKGDVTDYAWTKGLSPEMIVDKVKKQATRIQTTINQYREFYQDMKSRAPAGASDDLIKEMVFTAQQIKAYEQRFLTMFGETMDAIEPIIEVQSFFNEEGKAITDKEEQAKRFEQIKHSYERLFSMIGLPVKIPKVLKDQTDQILDFMESYADTFQDQELVGKIQDMRKLANSRAVFYQKLINLQGETGQQEYTKQAVTQEQINEKAEEAAVDAETEGFTTMEAVRDEYLRKNAKDQVDFYNTLEAAEGKNPAVKKFMDLKRRYDSFFDYVMSNGISTSNPAIRMTSVGSMITDIFHRASSEAEFQTLPDRVFPPLDEFRLQSQGIYPMPDGIYSELKRIIRESMKNYRGADSATASRNNIAEEPVTVSQETEEKPTGQDASQAASAAPAPTTLPDWMMEQPEEKQEKVTPVDPPEDPIPQAEQDGVTPMAEPASKEDIGDDAEEAAKEESIPGQLVEEGGNELIAYYRGSDPEISTGQANGVRDGSISREDADLSDFLTYLQNTKDEDLSEQDRKFKHDPESQAIWTALYNAHGFSNTATLLTVGDEIEFVIDSNFPKYKDEPQILMRTVKNGEPLVLNILSRQTAKYLGLGKLREAIMAEYNKHVNKTPNDLFVFSKKSKVWAKRAGQIEYDYSLSDPFANDKGLKDIQAYDSNAPIMFINKNGDLEIVKGKADAVQKLPPDSFPASFRSKRKGSVYYLAKNGDDGYIPIRLYVQHFTEETKGNPSPMFVKARSIISSIVSQANNANKATTDYKEENQKLHDKLAKLTKVLDVSDVYMELGNFNNIGPALMVVTWERDEDGNRINKDVQFRTLASVGQASQLTDDWLLSKIAAMGVSFHVGPGADIQGLIDDNILTTNAKMLRAKGVDFYIDPWDGATKTFHPMTEEQRKVQRELEKNEAENKPPKVSQGGEQDLVTAAWHTFKNFPSGVTEVGYFNQDKFPVVRFEHKGNKFMFTFAVNTKGNVYPVLRLYDEKRDAYYVVDPDQVNEEQLQRAVNTYLPKSFVDDLNAFEHDENGTVDEREDRFEKLLIDKYGIYYLNASLIGSKYEETDPSINRLKEYLASQSSLSEAEISEEDESWMRTDAKIGAKETGRREVKEEKKEGESAEENQPAIQKGSDGRYHFDTLPKEVSEKLAANGWTQEEFDAAEPEVQEYAIACADS
jgi:hypothetical protein